MRILNFEVELGEKKCTLYTGKYSTQKNLANSCDPQKILACFCNPENPGIFHRPSPKILQTKTFDQKISLRPPSPLPPVVRKITEWAP